ncbi:MAG: hypothetical protein JO345_03890 [Streptosporangiaceae bacterium]|nr:hypothetical protein [Streptosporangiaceae bacterium]
MPDSGSWDVVFGAESDPLILSVGFPLVGRREAGFAELAAKIGTTKYRFLQAKLLSSSPGSWVSGIAYVRHLIDEIRDRPIAAVLGHRVGSVYATALAEGISQWQQAPRVILFNPQFASVRLLGHELHSEIKAISSLLSDDEIARAGKLAAEIAESVSGDVVDAAAAAAGIYWEISSVAYDRVGIGGTYWRKSFAPFESYMSLLSAAGQIDSSKAWKRSTAIVSFDYQDGPLPVDDARGMVGHSIPFDVSHTDLLRSDSVAKKVLELLEFL